MGDIEADWIKGGLDMCKVPVICLSVCLRVQVASRENELFEFQRCPSAILKTRLWRPGQVHAPKLSNSSSTSMPRITGEESTMDRSIISGPSTSTQRLSSLWLALLLWDTRMDRIWHSLLFSFLYCLSSGKSVNEQWLKGRLLKRDGTS